MALDGPYDRRRVVTYLSVSDGPSVVPFVDPGRDEETKCLMAAKPNGKGCEGDKRSFHIIFFIIFIIIINPLHLRPLDG